MKLDINVILLLFVVNLSCTSSHKKTVVKDASEIKKIASSVKILDSIYVNHINWSMGILNGHRFFYANNDSLSFKSKLVFIDGRYSFSKELSVEESNNLRKILVDTVVNSGVNYQEFLEAKLNSTLKVLDSLNIKVSSCFPKVGCTTCEFYDVDLNIEYILFQPCKNKDVKSHYKPVLYDSLNWKCIEKKLYPR